MPPQYKPEQAVELDLGVAGNYERLAVNVDLFYRVIDDYITIVPDPNLPPRLPLSPPVVYRYINGDQARYLGGEASVQQGFGRGFQWRGSLSYVRAEDTFWNEPVYGIPPLSGELALRFTGSGPSRWWLEGTVFVAASQDRVAAERLELPTDGYHIFSVLGGVGLSRGLRLRAGVRNLTDESYVDHLNALDPFAGSRIPEIGRNAYVGLEYLF